MRWFVFLVATVLSSQQQPAIEQDQRFLTLLQVAEAYTRGGPYRKS
ncbi:MAG: hypothetical protein ACRD7E_24070 [Bryobacteraceae bacterium]